MIFLSPPTTVTVTIPSLPLPQALERLSKAAGERLECAPAFRDEPLFVRIKDASEARVLREIAALYDARWERRDDRQILLPDPDAARRRAAVTAGKDAKTLEGSFAYLQRRLAEQPARLTAKDASANERKRKAEETARKAAEERDDFANMLTVSTADEETPAWRAAARIVPLLRESTLLAMPYQARFVWSDVPTPAQRILPIEAANALRTYRGEVASFKPDVEVARVRVIVQRWEEGGAFTVTFEGVDRRGGTVDSADLRMNDDMDRLRKRLTVFDPPAPVPGEKPLVVPDEVEEYRVVVSNEDASTEKKAALRAKWDPILADPLAYEPTRWLPAGRLIAAAEALDKNLIGAPSEVTNAMFEEAHAGETPTQFIRRAEGVTERDGWLIEDGGGPNAASRDAGKRLIVDAIARGGVPLDSAAAWASTRPGPYPFVDWVGEHVGALLSRGGPHSAISTLLDTNGLRLWNALGAPARQALRNGARLDLSGLPGEARQRIGEAAYWHDGIQGGEPTELLPRGIDGGTVTLSVAEIPLTILSISNETGIASIPVSAPMLGRFLAKGDRYRDLNRRSYLAYDRYRMGLTRVYALHFLLGHEVVPLELDLKEVFFDPKAPTLMKLPEAFAKEVEAARLKAATTPTPTAPPSTLGKP